MKLVRENCDKKDECYLAMRRGQVNPNPLQLYKGIRDQYMYDLSKGATASRHTATYLRSSLTVPRSSELGPRASVQNLNLVRANAIESRMHTQKVTGHNNIISNTQYA